MKILFITSSRIGDAVLSTGLLRYIEQRYGDAKVTIVCGPLAVSLFEGYPLLERLIPLKKEKHHKHWLKLWGRTVGTRWDMVVDLRNSAVSRLIMAKERYIFTGAGCAAKTMHKVRQNAAVMRLGHMVPAPKLWFSESQDEKAEFLIPSSFRWKPESSGEDGKDPGLHPLGYKRLNDDNELVLGVGPTANWIGKTWPVERFIEIVEFMTASGGVMDGARVAVFGAPGEEEDALKVLRAIPEERRIDAIAKGTPGEAAAALARCDFYLGNDSGLMHCAAAALVPTLGLFGPSYDAVYHPWGGHADFVRTPESFDQLIDFDGYDPKTLDHTLMGSLSVEAVKAKITEMFEKRKAA
ncbi:MAG: glycosyltransferase family 9 protein [Rhodospirillales bacterium]|nr:glycosyltransferase family 9 protein [Rhodospirillales bacterium]